MSQAGGRDDDEPVAFDTIEDAERKLSQQQAPVAGVVNGTEFGEVLETFKGKINAAEKFFTSADLKVFEPVIDPLGV